MVRAWSIVLGIGLVILGLAGLNTAGATWIAWLDIVGGIISFIVAGSAFRTLPEYGTAARPRMNVSGGLLFLCVGLFAMWIIGLATGTVTRAMAWWNFAFACAYGLLTIASYGGVGMIRGTTTVEGVTHTREKPRRVA